MKQIKIQPLSIEAFAPYGQYYEMLAPNGLYLEGELHRFYPDRLTVRENCNLAFSPLVVKKPQQMIVTQAEYHLSTPETIVPLDDDMILHVAPPSGGDYPIDYTKAFWVPRGTVVKLNTAVWHLAPLPANNESLTALIVLPECIYRNDCTVVDLKDKSFEIVK